MEQLSTRNAELAALTALKTSVGSTFLGLKFDRGLAGSVTVTHNGKALGAWWYEDSVYKFAQLAHRPSSTLAESPLEVVSRTVAMAVNTSPPNDGTGHA